MTKDDGNQLPYRRCVGMMVLNAQGRVFVGRRINIEVGEAWQMPQGGIDEGEGAKTAALRELAEETGTDKAEIIAESKGWYYYDLPKELIPKVWNGKYRGQQQKWYAMRFTGADSDINIETQHPEFSAWKWVELSELPDVIVPFKRALYAALVAEFEKMV